MKQNCAALLRLTANLEFAACNLIASIEEQSPNLINDYIVYGNFRKFDVGKRVQ